jgi:CheY-like chemotaxis protein
MGKKILLADDSITIQKVIELTFSDEDFDVVTVGNGRLALEKLPEVRPDIVLCDIIMPEKDGYEVCEQIKADPAHAHIPVLLLTGAFEPFDQERASRAGYDGSLAKPFEPETLIAKVKDLLARGPVRPAAPAPPARAVTPPSPPPSPPAAPMPPLGARPAAVAPVAPLSAPMPRPPVPPPTVAPATVRPAAPPPLPTHLPPPPVVASPAVLPFARPGPSAPPASAPPSPPSFIPDEPFGGLDGAAFGEEPAAPAPDTFAPVTPEESATLLAPPASSEADAASTVMFRAGELPWTATGTPSAVKPAAPAPPPPAEPTARVPVITRPEPTFVPEPPEPASEPTVFEEVLEEDLDFGAESFEPMPDAEATGTVLVTPGSATLPPVARVDDASTTGAFHPKSAPEHEPEPAPVFEPEPAPAFEPEPAPVFEPEPAPAFEPEPAPVFEPEPAPTFDPGPAPVFEEPGPAEAPQAADTQSFADVASAVAEPLPAPPPPSEAAAVSVPVDMVERIAQRVVAQISEKAVREIAWEVIPDLAEALIKQEIERLKAELQKT